MHGTILRKLQQEGFPSFLLSVHSIPLDVLSDFMSWWLQVCGATDQLWMCLICGHVGCGRYNARHAVQHWHDTQHCYALELETKHVWDYVV